LRDVIASLVCDVPARVYRSQWRRSYGLDVYMGGQRSVYFLGGSDVVLSPPESLWKAVTLVEDALPESGPRRASRIRAIEESLSRTIPKARFDPSTFVRILAYVREYSDVNVSVCWEELEVYGVTADLAVRIVAENITVKELLNRAVAAANGIRKEGISARVNAEGVVIEPHRGPNPRELVVFRVCNSGVGDFAISVDGVGEVLYGERRKSRLGRMSDGQLARLKEQVRRVCETVCPGSYRSEFDHAAVIEIPKVSGSRVYILTAVDDDPAMPGALRELLSSVSGLVKW